ncbi:unnamed protein product [Calicophoron daubneyi]|uniref:C2H2-type domain-containing protein n=1 Tax=Calicophoron daubneyi TaxID=300641 RepID=A0AAV2T602_CALDB
MRKGKRRGGDEGFESADTVKETSLGPPSQSLMQSADSSDRIVLKAEDQRHSAIPARSPLCAPKRKGRPSLESYTNGPVQCETCRRHFRCTAALRMLTKNVHLTIASIKCDRCEKIFKRGQGLHNHMKKHLNYRYTTCKICKQPFATNSELRLHICISYQGTADTKCWVCKRIFDSLEVLRAHVGDSHAGSQADRVCKICGKEFYMKYYVKKHVRAVHQPQVKDKFCTICGKGFTRGSHLNAYVATIHEGWRTGPCDVCGKTFYKYSELREHFLAKHSERLDGRCDQCCKQFSDSEELRIHIATIHHGRHTFSCEVCQRVFSCFGYLKRHMTSTHSNKLPKDLLRYQLRGHNRKTVSRSRALRGEESEGSLTTDDDARNSGTDSEASLPASQVSECTSSANSEATLPMSIKNQIEDD